MKTTPSLVAKWITSSVRSTVGQRNRAIRRTPATLLFQILEKSPVVSVPVKLLTAGKQAKSGYDAGIHSLRTMLRYKCEQAGIDYHEVDEAYTTQVCLACGALPPTSPKGRADLGIRRWSCSACGALHDRDLNAACNIANAGAGHRPQ